jgi:hypothetical protein
MDSDLPERQSLSAPQAAQPPFTLAYSTKKPATDPGRTAGRFWETYLRVLDQLATAHRPTVPPTGERTVIIAIAVILIDHLFKPEHWT